MRLFTLLFRQNALRPNGRTSRAYLLGPKFSSWLFSCFGGSPRESLPTNPRFGQRCVFIYPRQRFSRKDISSSWMNYLPEFSEYCLHQRRTATVCLCFWHDSFDLRLYFACLQKRCLRQEGVNLDSLPEMTPVAADGKQSACDRTSLDSFNSHLSFFSTASITHCLRNAANGLVNLRPLKIFSTSTYVKVSDHAHRSKFFCAYRSVLQGPPSLRSYFLQWWEKILNALSGWTVLVAKTPQTISSTNFLYTFSILFRRVASTAGYTPTWTRDRSFYLASVVAEKIVHADVLRVWSSLISACLLSSFTS